MNYATGYSIEGGLSHILASPSATCYGPISLSIRPSVRLTVCQSVLTSNIWDCSSVRLLVCSLIRTSKTKQGALTLEPARPQMTIWRMRIAQRIPKATNTHSFNAYCFCTATMVTRTRPKVPVYAHCTSCVSSQTGSVAREV
jgi:hypothetical protein